MAINGLFQFNVNLRALAKAMLWCSLLSSVGSISANAGWDDSFIQGLNAHGTNSTIGLASGARLYNAPTNGKLPAGRVVEVEKSCVPDNGKAKRCKSSSPIAAIPSDRLAFSQCLSTSYQDIGPPNFSTPRVSVPQGEYANINLSGDSSNTLAFTTDNGIYKMKSLTATSGRLELSAGQYWIETLSINSGVTLVFPTNGTVSFFIKNDYTHQNLNLINASERLLLYNYGNFVLSGSAQLNAYVFAEGTATLNGSANLTGALTANQVKLEGNTRVTFADTVANVTTVPNCTLPAPPEVLACFSDDFNRSAVGDDWVVSKSSGTFTPSIQGGRLRLTEAQSNQSTASTYQRLFPAADNLVEIQFDHYAYGGNGADGIGLVLSDASITPQPGAFGGPLGYGYKPGISGFAGGWLGVGIDEYGNFSGEGGSYNIGQRRQSVAVRGSGVGTSGYRYLHGACNDGKTNTSGSCLSPVVDGNNVSPAHRYKITIDSQAANQSIVKIERNTGSGFVTLVPAFDAAAQTGQAAIPNDFLLSLTGSTGGSNNNHEIDNVQICALKSNPIGAQIDHFEFDHTGQGLTCNSETVTIRACANASCSQLFTDPLTATLLPDSTADGVWIGGGQVSFSNGSTQLQLRRNTPGVVTLGVKGSSPMTKPLSKTLCRIGAGALNENNCSLTFADSGFIFDVPDKLANKPVDVLVKAVKKSDTSQQCVPSFQNQTKTLNFWSRYVEPSVLISPQTVTINSSAIGASSAAPTEFNLVFDAAGQSSIAVNYPDAGKLQLEAKYTGTGDEQDLVMTGSDQFVSVPAGLCVKPVDTSALCPSANMSCNVYRKAGQDFAMTVQAVAWQVDNDSDFCNDNLPTPNFIDTAMTLASKVIAPTLASGANNGVLGVTSYGHSAQTNNFNTINNQTISEVGVFQIAAQAQPNYLGAASSLNIPIAYSANLGRFVPASFEVIDSSISAACGTFSYMDQGFGINYTLSAQNEAGVTTQNYIGAFAKASISLAGENANDGVDLSSRLTVANIANSAWIQGVVTILDPNSTRFTRLSAPLVDGPFESLALGLKVQDNDGNNASIAIPDMNAANTQNPCTSCDAKTLATTKLRHGRIVMDNTYGPETETLLMPTYAQYWNGSTWVINGDDSCTSVTPDLDNSAVYLPVSVTGQSVVRGQPNPNTTAGKLTLTWRNTGTNLYRGQVTAPLSVQPWLKWYWNWDSAAPNVLQDPRASAFFGRYRGHDRIIYWRETQ